MAKKRGCFSRCKQYTDAVRRRPCPQVLSISDFAMQRYGPTAKTMVTLITLFNMSIAMIAEYTTMGSLFQARKAHLRMRRCVPCPCIDRSMPLYVLVTALTSHARYHRGNLLHCHAVRAACWPVLPRSCATACRLMNAAPHSVHALVTATHARSNPAPCTFRFPAQVFVGSVNYPIIIVSACLTLAYTAYGGLGISIITDQFQVRLPCGAIQ